MAIEFESRWLQGHVSISMSFAFGLFRKSSSKLGGKWYSAMDKSSVIHGYILMPSRVFILSSYTDLYARLNCQAAHTYNRPREPNSPEPGAAKFEDGAMSARCGF